MNVCVRYDETTKALNKFMGDNLPKTTDILATVCVDPEKFSQIHDDEWPAIDNAIGLGDIDKIVDNEIRWPCSLLAKEKGGEIRFMISIELPNTEAVLDIALSETDRKELTELVKDFIQKEKEREDREL